jgi:hypothetical protein
MTRILAVLMLSAAAPYAIAQDAAAGGKTTAAASQAADEPVVGVKVVEDAPAAKKQEFKPPPGFSTKKRGELVLYCKKDATIGTRFKTEKCYSEDQVRDYLLAQEENKRNIDRIQRTCGSGTEACVHQ